MISKEDVHISKKTTLIVTHPVGLSADPAQQIISFINKYDSDLTLTYAGRSVNMKSLMGLVSLGIPTKAEIEINAEGYDEIKAIREITEELKKMKLIG